MNHADLVHMDMVENGLDPFESNFKPGDPRPNGYVAFHEWAEVQIKAGIKQHQCPKCKLWHFPQENHDSKTCNG